MRNIDKSIHVRAPAAKVWEVLTSPRYVPEWAGAFMPGAKAESDWRAGSEVTWTSDDPDMVMRGTVVESVADSRLKMTFPAGQAPDQDFDQSETFALAPKDGGVELTVTHGPLGAKSYETMEAPWDTALGAIKALAEADAPGRALNEASGADLFPPS